MKYNLYLIFDCKSYLTKIGKAKNVKNRISALQTANPYLRLLYTSNVLIEKELHEIYKDKRVAGEWFALKKEDIFEITNNYKSIPKELKYNNVNKTIDVNRKKAEVFKYMRKLEYKKVVGFTKQQKEAFEILEKYDVNVNKFIRQAVKEKLQRDWKGIKEKKERIKLPF